MDVEKGEAQGPRPTLLVDKEQGTGTSPNIVIKSKAQGPRPTLLVDKEQGTGTSPNIVS